MSRFPVPEHNEPLTLCGECAQPIDDTSRAFHCLYCDELTCDECTVMMTRGVCIICEEAYSE